MKIRHYTENLCIILFWILLWELASRAISNVIFLPGPYAVLKALFEMMKTKAFYRALGLSFRRIAAGFLAGFFLSLLLSFTGFFFPFFHRLIAPVLTLVKTVPVASVIILLLIWSGSGYLSFWIACFVTLPVLYQNIRVGLEQTDPELAEIAKVFRLSFPGQIRHLYFPTVLPYLSSGCRTAVGMSFKAGAAAEVIAVASGTIGEGIYLSKIYLCTDELFAWTIALVLLSLGFEKIVVFLLNLTEK